MEIFISISKYQELIRTTNSYIKDPSTSMKIVNQIMKLLGIKYKENKN